MSESKQNSRRNNLLAEAVGEKPATSVKGYTRAVRRKLYFLFALLLLVIVLMKEARKPENWMWMGFDRNAVADSSAIELNSFNDDPIEESQLSHDIAEGTLTSTAPSTNTLDSQTDLERTQFWKQLWQTLETEDKTALVELIQLTQKPLAERDVNWADFEPLAEAITDAKQVGENFPESWNSKIKPGLLAVIKGEDVTIGQQSKIGELFKTLDGLILDELDDFTSPSRKSDQPAWFRYWGRILDEEQHSAAEDVSAVQLVAQPDVWRFKPIRIRGRLLSGRSRKAGIHGPLRNQGTWYEWWIGNEHGASEVWCIYTANKPDSLEVGDKFSNFDVSINSNGYFYKVRSYVDGKSQGNHCPLIFADSLTVLKNSNPIAEATWTPSLANMITGVLAVVILAFGIAMLVHRSDRHKLPQPSGEYKEAINQHLDSLENDPDIKSMAERLEELS
jgi:hypothetical protein